VARHELKKRGHHTAAKVLGIVGIVAWSVVTASNIHQLRD